MRNGSQQVESVRPGRAERVNPSRNRCVTSEVFLQNSAAATGIEKTFWRMALESAGLDSRRLPEIAPMLPYITSAVVQTPFTHRQTLPGFLF